jgi:outer membrane protein assembly factor BamB
MFILLVSLPLTGCGLSGRKNPSGPGDGGDRQGQPPTATFTISPESGYIWETFTLDASSSFDVDGAAGDLRYYWTYRHGDEVKEDGWQSSPRISRYFHFWRDSLSVELKVRDADGLTDTCLKTIHFEPIEMGTARWMTLYNTSYLNTGRAAHAISSDGVLYLGGGRVREIVLPAGTENRTFSNLDISSPVLGDDGTIYGCTAYSLRAVDRHSGDLLWQYWTTSRTVGSPALAEDGTLYFSAGDTLHAVSADGSLQWAYRTATGITGSPSIGDDGTLYLCGDEDLFFAVNPSGTLKWTFTALGPYAAFRSSPAIGSDGTIYVGCDDRTLYALNPDGTLQWAFNTIGKVRSTPVIGTDGAIYVGTVFGWFYSIDRSGSRNWVVRLPGEIVTSAVIDTNEHIHVVYTRWHAFTFDRNGVIIRYYHLEGGSGGSSPTIHPDGTLCFSWYLLDTDSMGLADSPWPTFRGNSSNTGRR